MPWRTTSKHSCLMFSKSSVDCRFKFAERGPPITNLIQPEASSTAPTGRPRSGPSQAGWGCACPARSRPCRSGRSRPQRQVAPGSACVADGGDGRCSRQSRIAGWGTIWHIVSREYSRYSANQNAHLANHTCRRRELRLRAVVPLEVLHR
jgi:hypothetical protein